MTNSIVAGVVAFVLSWGVTTWLASSGNPLKILDKPNERSLHDKVVPRTGGLAVLLAAAIGWSLAAPGLGIPADVLWWGGLAVLAVFGVSLADDIRGIAPWLRLAVHFFAAAILLTRVVEGGDDHRSFFVITLLLVVWTVNLYNFMDGMDGFAGGMGMFGFGFLALAAWRADAGWLFGLTLVAAAANGGFLVINFPPARIFMGDAGSASMGLLVALFALWGIREGVYPVWVPILIFSPFIVDATITLLGRLFSGKKVWRPHRSHFYQRVVQAGWGHRKTVLAEYLLMVTAGGSAVFLQTLSSPRQAAGLFGWVFIYIGCMLGVYRLERCCVQKNWAGRNTDSAEEPF